MTTQRKRPQNEDDMRTPKTYTINNIQDFLQVPPDRMSECLLDFAQFMHTAGELKKLADSLLDAAGIKDEKPIVFGAFTWIDDGKRGGKITLKVSEDKLP